MLDSTTRENIKARLVTLDNDIRKFSESEKLPHADGVTKCELLKRNTLALQDAFGSQMNRVVFDIALRLVWKDLAGENQGLSQSFDMLPTAKQEVDFVLNASGKEFSALKDAAPVETILGNILGQEKDILKNIIQDDEYRTVFDSYRQGFGVYLSPADLSVEERKEQLFQRTSTANNLANVCEILSPK